MALIVETGDGVPGAESYLSVADADAYLAARGYAEWDAVAVDAKEAALRRATDHMEAVYGRWWLSGRSTGGQGLSWPRVGWAGVPAAVRTACAALALRALSGPLLPDRGPAVKEEAVGPLRVVYQDGAEQGRRFEAVDRTLAPLLCAATLRIERA